MTVGIGMTVGSLLVAVTASGWLSPAPAVMPLRLTVCSAASSAIAAGSGIASSVGGVFSVTASVNACVTGAPTPLVAVRVSG